jgi:hypothetical protein
VPGPAPSSTTHRTVICSLLIAASRFVPVPLLDDLVAGQVRRYLVIRTLRDHGRTFDSRFAKPLWESGGCFGGCLGALLMLPIKLILWPIRKILAVVGAVHGMAKDASEAILLGRAVERVLGRGELPDGAPGPTIMAQAQDVRAAYDVAVTNIDLRFLQNLLAVVFRRVKGLAGAALRAARRLVKRAPDDNAAEVVGPERGPIEAGAAEVEQALEQPEVARMLAEFDRRFDEALAARRAARTAPAA